MSMSTYSSPRLPRSQLLQEQELHSSIAKEKNVFIELRKKAQN